MADTLHAKIALDGGDDVAKQLKAIGDSGKQAFEQTQQAAQSAGQNLNVVQSAVSSLVSGFQQAAQSILSAGAQLGSAFNPLISAAGSALTAATKTGAGLGAIAGAAAGVSGAIGKIGQDAANSVAKLNDAATAVGLTTEKYRALKAGIEGIGVAGSVLDKMVSASERAARKAEVSGKPSRWRHVPGAPAAESDDASAVSDMAAKADGLTTSVLGAEREISNLPRVWKLANGQMQEIHAGSGVGEQIGGGYAKAADDLGVALRDLYGKARPGIEIARDVVLSLSKMEDGARRTDIAVRAFGEGLGQEVVQIADNREAIEQLISANLRAGVGLTEPQKKQADEVRRTGAVLADVKAQWQLYFQTLATPVTLDQNNAILDFLERNKAAIKDFGDNVIGPAVRWLGQFQNAFGASAIAAAGLGASLGLLSPLAAATFGAGGLAAIAFGDDIKNGALAAMTELTRIIKSNDLTTFDGWKNAARAVWEDIKQIASEAWEALRARVLSIDWGAAWANLKATAAGAWDFVKQTAVDAWHAIFAAVGSVDAEGIWRSLKESAVSAWEWLKAFVTSAWDGIEAQLAGVDFAGLWDGLRASAAAAWTAIVTIATEAYASIRAAALSAFPGLTGAWEAMERAASAVFASLKQMSWETWLSIGLGLIGLAGLFNGSFTTILALAAPFWRQILAGAFELFPGLRVALAPIASAFSDAFAAALPVIRAAWAYIRALMSGDAALQAGAWSVLSDAAATAWAAIRAAFSNGYAALRAQITSAVSWMTGPWEAMESAVADAWAAIKAEHQAGYPTIKGIWDNLVATWHGVKAAADAVAGAINLIFRTNYSGTQLLLIGVFLQVIGLAPILIEVLALVVVGIELFTTAIAAIPAIIAVAGAAITGLSSLAGGLSAAFTLLAANPFAALVIAAIVAIGVALYELYAHWDQIKAGAQAAWDAIKSGASATWDAIKGGASGFFDWFSAKWEALKALGGGIWDSFKTGATSAWDAVKATVTESVTWIEQKWDALIAKLKAAAASLVSLFSSGSKSGAANDNNGSSSSSSSSESAVSSAPGFASGGHISGPGTGTSDSIFAMLSNGEFVMSAKAVQAYGSDLFHSLNNLAFPGFAMGGMIGVSMPIPVPAFASGGQANRQASHAGMIAFTLDAGGRSFELMAPRDTVKDLQRHSAQSQMASANKRKPSWDR